MKASASGGANQATSHTVQTVPSESFQTTTQRDTYAPNSNGYPQARQSASTLPVDEPGSQVRPSEVAWLAEGMQALEAKVPDLVGEAVTPG